MTAEERFWAKVKKFPGDGCWEWTGARDTKGYGNFKVRSYVTTKASRFSYDLHNGPTPDGMDVCHRCDNPPCVRPDHLFLGSRRKNMRDASRKGRIRNQNSDKRRCTNGHLLAGENLRVYRGKRQCRECQRRYNDPQFRVNSHSSTS